MVRLWPRVQSKRVMRRSRGHLGSGLVSGRALWSKEVAGLEELTVPRLVCPLCVTSVVADVGLVTSVTIFEIYLFQSHVRRVRVTWSKTKSIWLSNGFLMISTVLSLKVSLPGSFPEKLMFRVLVLENGGGSGSRITDRACKNQLVVVSVQYGPFNPYIPIRSTTIGKSRVAKDPIAMHTSWRSNSDIASVTSACKNQLVVVSVQYGPFNPYIPSRSTTIGKSKVARDPITMHTSWRSNSDIASVTRASMTFRVVRTNQYNQDLGLIHSTNGNHLESPNEGSSIDHQVTIHMHAQNITMFPTNETWYFAWQILVSSSGGLILILTAQSTRN
ncbi:hypothetical protein F511_36391 [Dorcoceras hygrometricum]|uniref:Triacylglycerol lipase n=1 Tax=Dorcoceras hygrometricum TaxID=472368 RepID=A0A2Z7B7V6_9LAMI|nr:hypothetical protein F511_36391 [Dorcoceras hygrometricum]